MQTLEFRRYFISNASYIVTPVIWPPFWFFQITWHKLWYLSLADSDRNMTIKVSAITYRSTRWNISSARSKCIDRYLKQLSLTWKPEVVMSQPRIKMEHDSKCKNFIFMIVVKNVCSFLFCLYMIIYIYICVMQNSTVCPRPATLSPQFCAFGPQWKFSNFCRRRFPGANFQFLYVDQRIWDVTAPHIWRGDGT